MNNIVIFVIVVVIFFYVFHIGNLKCDSNDVSCAAWTNKDVLSKCDAFCKEKLGQSFSHSQKFDINPDGSVDCKCLSSKVNDISHIGTPSTNVPPVIRENFPLRAGELPKIENLTNIEDSGYDSAKNEQYKRFNKLIFG
jgi:hypothetical protein